MVTKDRFVGSRGIKLGNLLVSVELRGDSRWTFQWDEQFNTPNTLEVWLTPCRPRYGGCG